MKNLLVVGLTTFLFLLPCEKLMAQEIDFGGLSNTPDFGSSVSDNEAKRDFLTEFIVETKTMHYKTPLVDIEVSTDFLKINGQTYEWAEPTSFFGILMNYGSYQRVDLEESEQSPCISVTKLNATISAISKAGKTDFDFHEKYVRIKNINKNQFLMIFPGKIHRSTIRINLNSRDAIELEVVPLLQQLITGSFESNFAREMEILKYKPIPQVAELIENGKFNFSIDFKKALKKKSKIHANPDKDEFLMRFYITTKSVLSLEQVLQFKGKRALVFNHFVYRGHEDIILHDWAMSKNISIDTLYKVCDNFVFPRNKDKLILSYIALNKNNLTQEQFNKLAKECHSKNNKEKILSQMW